jgi:hypothetical protein
MQFYFSHLSFCLPPPYLLYANYMFHLIFPMWATRFVHIFSPVWATLSTHLIFHMWVTLFTHLLFSMRATYATHLISIKTSTLFPHLLSPLWATHTTLLTPCVWAKHFLFLPLPLIILTTFLSGETRKSWIYCAILCNLLSLPPFLSPNILSLAPYSQNSHPTFLSYKEGPNFTPIQKQMKSYLKMN